MWSQTLQPAEAPVTCTYCGLGCDDLRVDLGGEDGVRIENACDRGRQALVDALGRTSAEARIDGRKQPRETAIARAAELIGAARAPLFGGLATDVNGTRAALALADRVGASLDHRDGDALFRNLLLTQDSGWFTTTFTEARNRADLVLMIGNQFLDRFPRLVDRVLAPREALFTAAGERRLVLLGPWGGQPLPPALAALGPTVIDLACERVGEYCGLLRALLAGRPARPDAFGASLGAAARELVEALKSARYSVVGWSAAEFEFSHAELHLQNIVELVRELNRTTRSGNLLGPDERALLPSR